MYARKLKNVNTTYLVYFLLLNIIILVFYKLFEKISFKLFKVKIKSKVYVKAFS